MVAVFLLSIFPVSQGDPKEMNIFKMKIQTCLQDIIL